MENNMVIVRSASDWTLVVNIPEIPLRRTWRKKGAKYPIDRNVLMQAFYDSGVESLFREGLLVTDDKDFMYEVGLLDPNEKKNLVELTDQYMHRLIATMPLKEFELEIKKLSRSQIEEVATYAIVNNKDLNMDRIDVLSAASNKEILKAITNYKASQEA